MSTHQAEKVILSVKGLTKIFHGKRVLNDFDLDIKEGEVHAVFGEIGAGKTTFIKIVAGIYRHEKGAIFVNGTEEEFKNAQDAFKAGLSFVHQQLAIFPELSVRDNILLGQHQSIGNFEILSKKRLKVVEEIPNALELGVDLDTPAKQLTQIQHWKMAINRALARKPKLILMDDPATGLGLEDTKELFRCIKHLKKSGTTVVYMTSRMQEVFEVADRVTIIQSGMKVGSTIVKEKDSWNVFKMMVGKDINLKLPSEKIFDNRSGQASTSNEFSNAYQHSYTDRELENIQFERIIGQSKAIKNVLAQVLQVAKSDANVLILGETGVGKELIAEAVHYHSLRIEKPFICVHCSAFPESLLPSELFGHEKGAFTGANERRIGRFELANNGTLFLDEIGEFSQDVQIRLLRVLQSKQFERVGGVETVKSDFRLIAATNRNLEKEVEAKRFRKDLFFRLNVVPIYVPALRERKEDIPLLANYFLMKYAKKLGKTFDRIEKGEMEQLIQYDWPGNIRELENVIERAAIMSRESTIQLYFFKPLSFESKPEKSVKTRSIKEMEKHHIISALEQSNWKVRGSGGAAEFLQMNESTLRSRMKKHNIRRNK